MEINVEEQKWRIHRMGNGSQQLIALHGYGQHGSVFRHLSELLNDTYTLLTVDLAFHGDQHDFPEGFLFDKAYAETWLNEILLKTGLESIGLVGYSIGGRIALSLASWFPEKVSELWLLAPDGMPVSRFYRFVTATFFGEWMFRRFVNVPALTFSIVNAGRRTGFFPKKVADFYMEQIGTREKRKQLFDTWRAYRQSIPERKVLLTYSKTGKLPATCILGISDAVIRLIRTRKAISATLPGARVIEIEIGHHLLSEKAMKKLAEYWRE